MAKNIYQIIAGPEKSVLVASLATNQEFTFEIGELGELTARLNSMEREDGSGHSWNIECYVHFENQDKIHTKGYFHDKSSTGFVELPDDYVEARRSAIAPTTESEVDPGKAQEITLEDDENTPAKPDLSEVEVADNDTATPQDPVKDCSEDDCATCNQCDDICDECEGCDGCDGEECDQYDTCEDAGCPGCEGSDDDEEDDDCTNCCVPCLAMIDGEKPDAPVMIVNAEAGSTLNITFNF